MFWRTSTALAILFSITSCKNPLEDIRKDGGEVAQVEQIPFASSMETSLNHLDTDGNFLQMNDISAEMQFIRNSYRDFDKIIRGLADEERVKLPSKFSVANIMGELEVDQIKAIGSSSKKVDRGWINKIFVDTAGKDGGLLGLYKHKVEQWNSPSIAPDTADYVLEQSLNLEQLFDLLDYAAKLTGKDYDEVLQKALSHQPQTADETISKMLENYELRASYILELDQAHSIKQKGGSSVPNAELAICIEGGATIWQFFAEDIEKDSLIEEKDGLRYVKAEKQYTLHEALPQIHPMFVVDQKKDRLWFVLRQPYFEKLQNANKLMTDQNYQKLAEDMPQVGFSYAYASPELLDVLAKFYTKEQMRSLYATFELTGIKGAEGVAAQVIDFLADDVFAKFGSMKNGMLSTSVIKNEGIYSVNIDVYANKGLPSLSHAVIQYAIIGMAGSTQLDKQVKRSRMTKAINNAKDCYISIRDYHFEHNKPLELKEGDSANDVLRQLLTHGYAYDERMFSLPVRECFIEADENMQGNQALAKGELGYAYCPGPTVMDSPANRPLLMTPLTKKEGKIVADPNVYNGQAIVLRTDGSCAAFPVNEKGEIVTEEGNLLDPKHPDWKLNGKSPKSLQILLPESL